MKEHLPAQPRPPGAILKRELSVRGWSQKDLAEILARPPQVITEIVRGTKQITPDTALELAAAFGTVPSLWTNLETEYRLHLARAKHSSASSIERRARLFQRLPVAELTRRKWLRPSKDVDELEREVCAFLGVSALDEEPKLLVSYRRSADSEDVAAAQRAWVRRIEIVAAKQRLRAKFTADKLRGAIDTLRKLAGREEGVASVPPLLNSLGVHFLVVRHLPKTKIDGAAAFTAHGPVVALTLRYDRIDWFWFTLMHEVAHLALGHRAGHLDFLEGERVSDKDEREANAFASEALLKRRAVESFVHAHGKVFSKSDIETFAAKEGIHPGIVVGQLQHDGTVPYSHFRSYLVRVAHHLTPWIDG